LQSVLLVKTFLQWMQFAVLFQALDSHNLASIRLHREHRTGLGGFAIHQDGARPACRRIATNVRSCQMQRIADPVHK
jgi:hypothetical protein